MHQSRSLRSKLTEMGFSIKKSSSHIILIHFSEEENFQSFVNHLIDENILAFIHKPSLTIRLCITTCHQKEVLGDFIVRIKNWQKPLIYSKL
jgi:7-keto-8-aminopelargonate synthetase-like enzyme